MSIRAVLVDDEPPALDELAFLLSAFDDIEVVARAASAREAVAAIREHAPDVVFLDIEMPGGNGFDVVAEVLDAPPLFVFATAFDQYAIRAFEENATDYILKPATRERLAKSLARVREALAAQGGTTDHEHGAAAPQPDVRDELQKLLSAMGATPHFTRVAVEREGRIALLRPEEIAFIATEDRRTMAHTARGALPCHGSPTMDALEERLAAHGFFRTNRGALINLARVREFSPWFNGKYNCVMDDADGSEVTVSRGRVPAFKERLGL